MMAGAMLPLLTRRQRWVLGALRFAIIRGGHLLGWLIFKCAGVGRKDSGPFVTAAVAVYQDCIDLGRAAAIDNGQARQFLDMESVMARLAASIRPDSQWRFHEAQRGALRVLVLPRIIDSNTGVVLASSDLSAGQPGDVVTFDGLPPNCDPPALDQILHGGPLGPAPPTIAGVPAGGIDAEFLPHDGAGVPAYKHVSDSKQA